MKIAVIGGAGFIGSALVRRLVLEGEAVTVFDNFARGTPKNLPTGITLVKADAREGGLNLRGFDQVYDFAARVAGVRNLYGDPGPLLSDNIRITLASVQAVVDCEVPRYFFVSSSCVYDFEGAKVPHREDDTNICNTSYGFSKVAGEQIALWYSRQYGFRLNMARLFNVYGPGDSAMFPHVIPEFIQKARACAKGEKTFPILGAGNQTRDFTWIDDVVHGLLTIAEKGASGEVYNIGTQRETSIRALAEMVCRAAGLDPLPTFVSEPVAKEDIQRRAADITKLRSLGYEPSVDIEQGVRMMMLNERVTA